MRVHYLYALGACCVTCLWVYNVTVDDALRASYCAVWVVWYIYEAEKARRAVAGGAA